MNSDMDTNSYYEGAGDYDRETVRFFDVAHEGAQLRAIAGRLQGKFEQLRGLNPRSVVIVGTDQIARAAARYVVQLRSPLRCPVVVVDTLPAYLGALDVVIMVGDAADNDDFSRDIISAGQRGATTIFAGPAQGPLIDDVPDSALVIPALLLRWVHRRRARSGSWPRCWICWSSQYPSSSRNSRT
ncbi:hypothetical protein [Corynebacterium pilosum]|uniref:hypothetical protein n=1 Tax=Corynebacterium pilosum TaxID=35756 RepID=UPI0030162DB5